MSEARPLLFAKWTDDCQGKKSYDGPVLVVSSRYWPPNGMMITTNTPGRPIVFSSGGSGKHTARCSLDIIDREGEDEFGDHISLIEADFEGPSFEAVREKLEAWAQGQVDRAVRAIRNEFYVDPNGSPR